MNIELGQIPQGTFFRGVLASAYLGVFFKAGVGLVMIAIGPKLQLSGDSWFGAHLLKLQVTEYEPLDVKMFVKPVGAVEPVEKAMSAAVGSDGCLDLGQVVTEVLYNSNEQEDNEDEEDEEDIKF